MKKSHNQHPTFLISFISATLIIPCLALLTSCAPQGTFRMSRFGFNVHAAPTLDPTNSIAGDTPDPLDPKRRIHILLQVDGGGIMGITPAMVVNEMEKELAKRPDGSGKKLKDYISVCVGTSTGSIIAGMIAAGVPAQVIEDYYLKDGIELFNTAKNPIPFFPLFQYRFQRAKFQEKVYDVLQTNSDLKCGTQTMDDLYNGPLLVIPAYDLISRKTLFIRNRESDDSHMRHNRDVLLLDAISASAFSATLFFGKLPAPEFQWQFFQADGYNDWRQGSVFNDGGQATQNSASAQTALEAIVRQWGAKGNTNDQVAIISLGCGDDFTPRTYREGSHFRGTDQLIDFVFGNQARREAALLQWLGLKRIEKSNPNFKVFRFDWVIGTNSTSAFSINNCQKQLYMAQATNIIQRKDFRQLMKDLCQAENIVKPGPTH